MAYLTVKELKRYLDLTGSADDVLLTNLISKAQRWVESFTNRQFEVTSDSTRYIDAVGLHIEGNRLYIADMGDIYSITTVTNGDGVEVTSTEYTTYPKTLTQQEPVYQSIRILSNTTSKYWTWTDDWENAISITGKWGYSASPPEDVKQATRQIVAYLYRQKDAQVFDVTAIPDAGVIQIPQGIPRTARLILEHYRRMR